MDMIVIGDYYHMTIMDGNIKWMRLTHLLLIISRKHKPLPLLYIYVYFKVSIALLNVHTKEKRKKKKEKTLLHMYIMYDNTSNNTPFYTHVSSYVIRRIHSPDSYLVLVTICWHFIVSIEQDQ
jgi:hypothetical protein